MLLKPFDRGMLTQPRDAPRSAVSLRYLGAAGFAIESPQRTIVLDPFLSRAGLLATGLRPLRSDADRLARVLPRADDVLISHAHVDHVLDAPALCAATGARFLGSPDACNVARAAGLPEAQIRPTAGRESIACGPATARALPSRHGRVYFGRVPFPGSIPAPPPWPPRARDLRHGLVLSWWIELAGVRLLHIGSADFLPEEVADLRADVLLLAALGRNHRPRYVAEAVELLRPRYVVACHWDWFFTPYEQPPLLMPEVALPGFLDEIDAAGAEPILLPFGGEIRL